MSRTLVLLHGYTGSTKDFEPVRPALESIARVVAFDQRGHGTSREKAAENEGPITLERLAEDLRAHLEAQVREPAVHLLGHSMGGMVALRFALAFPARVASLILAGTGANAVPMGEFFAPSLRSRLRGLLHRDNAANMAAALYGSNDARRQFAATARAGHRAVHPRAASELHAAITTAPSLVPRLGEIRAPVTVIVGEQDNTFRYDAVQLSQEIPDAKLVILKHASHYPHFEQPQAFLAAIEAHFQRVSVATKTS